MSVNTDIINSETDVTYYEVNNFVVLAPGTDLDGFSVNVDSNPIVLVNQVASQTDNWFYVNNPSEQYIGLYHVHEDGTTMTGAGVMGASHEINWDEVIYQEVTMMEMDFNPTENLVIDVGLVATEQDRIYFKNNIEHQYIGEYHKHQDGTLHAGNGSDFKDMDDNLLDDSFNILIEKFTYETLQQVREIVSDLFYKLWFQNNTLTDEQVLSMQTTIRDGKKQTGRDEDEPLVFYKKDRNTLENREDLQGKNFELICQNIHESSIIDIESKFSLELPDEIDYSDSSLPLTPGEYYKLQQYVMRYNNDGLIIDVIIAEEVILYFDEAFAEGDF